MAAAPGMPGISDRSGGEGCMRGKPRSWLLRALAGLGAAVLATACASAPAKRAELPVFFPPPPDLPRLQYLTSYSSLNDVEEQSRFNRFVVGPRQDIKLTKPYGVAIRDGKIYVCDTNAGVTLFDLKNKTFESLKGAAGPGRLLQPMNIRIEADGIKNAGV